MAWSDEDLEDDGGALNRAIQTWKVAKQLGEVFHTSRPEEGIIMRLEKQIMLNYPNLHQRLIGFSLNFVIHILVVCLVCQCDS